VKTDRYLFSAAGDMLGPRAMPDNPHLERY
jgi:hypothetical protein